MIEDGVGSINEELAYEYVEQLGYKYDTLHYDRNFHTSIGTDIVIPSSENDYGYMIYTDGEFSQLLQDIESNKDVEREPVYYTTASDYGNPVFYRRDGRDDLAGVVYELPSGGAPVRAAGEFPVRLESESRAEGQRRDAAEFALAAGPGCPPDGAGRSEPALRCHGDRGARPQPTRGALQHARQASRHHYQAVRPGLPYPLKRYEEAVRQRLSPTPAELSRGRP